MKRIIVLIFALIFAFSLAIVVHAEEIADDETITGEDLITEDPVKEEPSDLLDEKPTYEFETEIPPDGGVIVETIFTRLLQWWKTNSEEILAVAYFVGSAIGAGLVKYLGNKVASLGDKTEKKIAESYGKATDKTNELVDAYNDNVDEIKNLEKLILELIHKVVNLDQKVLETEQIEESIAKILTTAYTNSRLPNGTKDMISTECAQIINKVHGYISEETGGNEDVKED